MPKDDLQQPPEGRINDETFAGPYASLIVESIPLPLVVVDSELRICANNQAFRTLAESNSQILTGGLLDQPLHSQLEALTQDNGAANSFEFEHEITQDGSKVLLVRGRLLRPDGERLVVVTFEDITRRRDVERLLATERQRLTRVETAAKELDRSRQELHALAGSLLNSQEDERRRLARELHDDISQRLATLNIIGDEILKTIAISREEAMRKLEVALKQIVQLSDDVRTLSHRLHPSVIEDLGLRAALRALTEEFGEREEMIATFFARNVPETLHLDMATALYRIAQEALRNVAKHAGKTDVKVQLVGVRGGLELEVVDAGKGFDPEQNLSGLGLICMRERARLIGAKLNVQSAPREGTRVTVQAPLAAAD